MVLILACTMDIHAMTSTGRHLWLNRDHLFVGPLNFCRVHATASGKRPPEWYNKDSCGAVRDVSKMCREGRLKEALHILDAMEQRCIQVNYFLLLKVCIKMKSLPEGKLIHAHIIKGPFKPNKTVGNTLVNMYVKHGNVVDARQVFDNMPERDVVSWTAMISGY
eukprot:c53744_g1_i1 orf=1-489(-)